MIFDVKINEPVWDDYVVVRKKNQCPDCGGPLVVLNSQNLKICNDCKKRIDNPLKPGQTPDY